MKATVKHIPERGCYNCRLHCVNHRQCNSEYPCKLGGEWRPIVQNQENDQSDKSKDNPESLKSVDEVLEDEMSQNMLDYLEENTVFKEWIKDAMYKYAESYHQEKVREEKPTDQDIANAANDYWKDDVKENPDHLPFAPTLFAAYNAGATEMRDKKIYVSPKDITTHDLTDLDQQRDDYCNRNKLFERKK